VTGNHCKADRSRRILNPALFYLPQGAGGRSSPEWPLIGGILTPSALAGAAEIGDYRTVTTTSQSPATISGANPFLTASGKMTIPVTAHALMHIT
jgi:hypothetical protein